LLLADGDIKGALCPGCNFILASTVCNVHMGVPKAYIASGARIYWYTSNLVR